MDDSLNGRLKDQEESMRGHGVQFAIVAGAFVSEVRRRQLRALVGSLRGVIMSEAVEALMAPRFHVAVD
ncbi:hypothetical protein P9250_32200 [Caballeronia sp. LP006]|uniref:hypothetical protein n=1 Tax=Caballeronia sp. LP006 TaxID=3038552 RepID=UPI0028604A83|nr:hypothetical protein [Caballeronia sp. LP006]MDR5832513.1 hypothetical protein [Caballeronia sp. LP006]